MPNINWQELLLKFRWQLTFVLMGLLLIGGGLLTATNLFSSKPTVEILNTTDQKPGDIVVEIAGSVESPGVYSLSNGSRVEDLLVAAGGLSSDANRDIIGKTLNRAAKLSDGQKIYIPSNTEQTSVLSANESTGESTVSNYSNQNSVVTVNINQASKEKLESLWGIGPVTAQNIIDNRPYSNVEELLSKGILKRNVYDRNKELLTIY